MVNGHLFLITWYVLPKKFVKKQYLTIVESSQTHSLLVQLPKGADEQQIGYMVSLVHGICCLRAPPEART